jgi:hypothetical protein
VGGCGGAAAAVRELRGRGEQRRGEEEWRQVAGDALGLCLRENIEGEATSARTHPSPPGGCP